MVALGAGVVALGVGVGLGLLMGMVGFLRAGAALGRGLLGDGGGGEGVGAGGKTFSDFKVARVLLLLDHDSKQYWTMI